MEISATAPTAASSFVPSTSLQHTNSLNALILETNFSSQDESDSAVIDINRLGQGLSLTADEIISKLNEQLKGKVPAGIESLKPEDHTAEKTASAIVDSVTALFDRYRKSNPELSPEEQLARFMAAARSGVDQGYDDAYETLEGLGAFSFEGVKSGIEQTKVLIASKLDAFEEKMKKEMGIREQGEIAEVTATALKVQSGVNVAA